jgi:hypothetical protein
MSAADAETFRLAQLAPRLVEEGDVGALLDSAREVLRGPGDADVLARAVGFTLDADSAPLELSFVSLYTALESALTFFRRQYEYKILPADDFARLERDLKGWLRQHPLLKDENAKRGLVYEKVRELNRYPFSHVFRIFCERLALDLSDLWPLTGNADDWPLVEIRHRLVHGDPFRSRPTSAVECAREHLRWTVERMILSVVGWTVERSRVSPAALTRAGETYTAWRDERAKLA